MITYKEYFSFFIWSKKEKRLLWMFQKRAPAKLLPLEKLRKFGSLKCQESKFWMNRRDWRLFSLSGGGDALKTYWRHTSQSILLQIICWKRTWEKESYKEGVNKPHNKLPINDIWKVMNMWAIKILFSFFIHSSIFSFQIQLYRVNASVKLFFRSA